MRIIGGMRIADHSAAEVISATDYEHVLQMTRQRVVYARARVAMGDLAFSVDVDVRRVALEVLRQRCHNMLLVDLYAVLDRVESEMPAATKVSP